MAFESQGVERKEIAIMRILSDSNEAVGARVIAHNTVLSLVKGR